MTNHSSCMNWTQSLPCLTMFLVLSDLSWRDEWWRHQVETFSALQVLCMGNSPVTGAFPAQRPMTLSFDVFFDLHLNKRLSKQPWGWWFETPSRPFWRHCNDYDARLERFRMYFVLNTFDTKLFSHSNKVVLSASLLIARVGSESAPNHFLL